MKSIKGRPSHHLQEEFPELKRRYWGRHFWTTGYVVWSTGNITDEMLQEYLEHHKNKDDNPDNVFIL